MKDRQTFLAFDLGATSGRGVAGSLEDERLVVKEVYRFANEPVRVFNGYYRDVLRHFTKMKRFLTVASREYRDEIRCLGIDTAGVAYAFLDADGMLIENPGNYTHNRIEGMDKRVFELIPREEIFEHTGALSSGNAIYQLFSLIYHKSPILNLVKTFVMMPGLFTYWLTGKVVSEFTDATTTQLYDVQEEDWSEVIFGKLNLPLNIMSKIVTPRTVLGPILPYICEETKIDGDIKVVATASHDTAAAVAAVPVQGENWAFISSGTVSIMGVELDQPVINKKAYKYDFSNEGGVEGTYRFLRNISGMRILEECRRVWDREGLNYSYEDLIKMAASSRFKSIIDGNDPFILGPGDMPEKIHQFCKQTGQKTPKNKEDVLRCIFESLALKYSWTLNQLEDTLDKKIETVHIIGGGSRNQLLCQLAADAMGRRVLAGPAEATSIGNIVVQMLAEAQLTSLKEARSIIRNSFDIEAYEPQEKPDLDERFNQLLSIMEKRKLYKDYY